MNDEDRITDTMSPEEAAQWTLHALQALPTRESRQEQEAYVRFLIRTARVNELGRSGVLI